MGSEPGVSHEEVRAWLEADPSTARFGLHRGLGRKYPGAEHAWTVGMYAAAADASSEVWAGRGPEGLAATVVVDPKPMETASFGVPTLAVSHVASALDGDRRHDAARALLAGVLASRPEGQLLILRVDSDDPEVLVAAQTVGFRVVESTAAWYGDSETEDPGPVVTPDGVTIEIYDDGVVGALTEDEIVALARSTSFWEQTKYRAERRLPQDRVDDFYRRWVPNIASGEWCDCLYVAREDGRLIAILNEVSDRALREVTGLNLRVGEWIVSIDPKPGVGRALLATAGRHPYSGGRYRQWETQLRNLATIRSIEGTGVATPIRTAYTLHAWS